MTRHLKQKDYPALRMPRLSLRIGQWKELFAGEEYKLIIARALNYCVYEKRVKYHVERSDPRDTFLFTRLHIVGYLITHRMVHLVLESEQWLTKEEENNILQKLIDSLNNKIQEAIEIREDKNIQQYGPSALDDDDDDQDYELPDTRMPLMHLIEMPPFANHVLVKLITGTEVELGHYNPQLARLKDHLHNYPFCSAIDYGGAKGPVLISKPDSVR